VSDSNELRPRDARPPLVALQSSDHDAVLHASRDKQIIHATVFLKVPINDGKSRSRSEINLEHWPCRRIRQHPIPLNSAVKGVQLRVALDAVSTSI
jgi:hypothetical protein